ncbi:MAG: hypothetical protein WBB29_15495 [Geitlerinemataceae cyanobacterium]
MSDLPRSRQPGDSVFATFKIPYDKWQHFQQAAQLQGKTASATLVEFIEGYLSKEEASNTSSETSPSALPDPYQLETVIREMLDDRLRETSIPKIANLEEKLDRLEIVLRKFDERLGKVETIVSQWKAKQYEAPELVDVEAFAVESDRSTHSPPPEKTAPKDGIGVAEQALCEQFGLNPDNLLRHAQMRGLSASEYLHQVTGWVYRDGKYYPGDTPR